MNFRSTLPLVATLLAGCAAAPPPAYGPAAFRLGLDEPAAPIAAAGVPASIPADQGVLTVQFGHLLKARRLLATLADVDKVTIHLAGTGVDQTATILKAALISGTASHTFAGLPPGALTVTIKALDAAGATIGQDVQQATVAAGNATTVTSTLNLAPGVTTTRPLDRTPLNGPSGGSGGGASTGSLDADVTIEELPVQTATYVGAYAPPAVTAAFASSRIDVDGAGKLWTLWRDDASGATPCKVATIATDGTVTEVATGTSKAVSYFHRQPTSSTMFGMTPLEAAPKLVRFVAGSADAAVDGPPNGGELTVAPDGRAVWRRVVDPPEMNSFAYTQVYGSSPELLEYGGFEQEAVAASRQTHPVVVNNTWIPTGATFAGAGEAEIWLMRAFEHTWQLDYKVIEATPLADLAAWKARFNAGQHRHNLLVDAQDRSWVTTHDGRTLWIHGATNVPVAKRTLAHPAVRLFLDEAGRVWGYPGPEGIVTRFDPDGTPAAYYYLGEDVEATSMAVTPDGHLWIAEGTRKDLLHFTVAIP